MWFQKAAEGGNYVAQNAAEGGNHYAQWRLGDAYEFGDKLTLTIDLGEALKWYRMAADSGHAGAQGRLAVAYDKGDLGQEIDLQVADMWFKKSDASAQLQLGEAYEAPFAD